MKDSLLGEKNVENLYITQNNFFLGFGLINEIQISVGSSRLPSIAEFT